MKVLGDEIMDALSVRAPVSVSALAQSIGRSEALVWQYLKLAEAAEVVDIDGKWVTKRRKKPKREFLVIHRLLTKQGPKRRESPR